MYVYTRAERFLAHQLFSGAAHFLCVYFMLGAFARALTSKAIEQISKELGCLPAYKSHLRGVSGAHTQNSAA